GPRRLRRKPLSDANTDGIVHQSHQTRFRRRAVREIRTLPYGGCDVHAAGGGCFSQTLAFSATMERDASEFRGRYHRAVRLSLPSHLLSMPEPGADVCDCRRTRRSSVWQDTNGERRDLSAADLRRLGPDDLPDVCGLSLLLAGTETTEV